MKLNVIKTNKKKPLNSVVFAAVIQNGNVAGKASLG